MHAFQWLIYILLCSFSIGAAVVSPASRGDLAQRCQHRFCAWRKLMLATRDDAVHIHTEIEVEWQHSKQSTVEVRLNQLEW